MKRELRKIGRNAYICVKEMVDALEANPQSEEARTAIEQDPLSIEVRSDWHDIGGQGESAEYCILLSTGGPAVRIVGDLEGTNGPSSARLEVQDWGTPWTEYPCDEDVLLTYANVFYWGD
jgi:hypothetical protein